MPIIKVSAKNRKAILPSESLPTYTPTVEEKEFKGNVNVSLADVPELEEADAGDLVQLTFEAEVKSVKEDEEGTTYNLEIRQYGYEEQDKESLDDMEKRINKDSE